MTHQITEHNAMRLRVWCLVMIILLGCISWRNSVAADSCSLVKPPHDAAVSGNHGSYYFAYPRHITATFTGCQTLWDELGRKVYVYRFRNGELIRYSLTDYANDSSNIVCKYRNRSLTADSPPECSAYDSVKSGLLNVELADEPPVPKERDPRLR
jgi:hypothetical protein